MSAKAIHRVQKRTVKNTLRDRRRLFFESLDERLPLDADDSISEATSLGSVSPTPIVRNDSISPDTDVDMYRFSVNAGQTVDFDIDTPTNGPGSLGSFLRIFNSSGTELAFNNDGMAPGENGVGFDAYIRHLFPTAGNYYVSVSNNTNTLFNPTNGNGDVAGGQNSTGTYQLTITALPDDDDDTLVEATNLGAIGTTPDIVNESIETDVDVDLYRFSVTTGEVVDFDIDTTLNGPGGLGSYIRIFNSSGQEVGQNNDGVGIGENVIGFDSYLRFTFTTSGTFYVGVSNFANRFYNPTTGLNDTSGGANSIGAYRLTVQTAPTNPNDTDDETNEATNLSTITTAAVIRTGDIDPAVDVDMYRFSVSTGQIVDFDIDTTLNGSGGLGSFLRLFNSSGTELAFNNDAAAPGETGVGFDAYLRYTFPSQGTYYLGVSNNNNTLYNPTTGVGDVANNLNGTGSYTLTIQGVAVDDDDELTEATSLGSITTAADIVADSITPDTDVDLYRFTVGAGQVVDFDIDTTTNGPGGVDSFLRIFNSSGTEIAFNNNGIGLGENVAIFDSYLRHTFVSGGTYYLGVSNSTNTLYNASTGGGDVSGGANNSGSYTLYVQTAPAVPTDSDDQRSEAPFIGAITTTPYVTTNAVISPDVDVDLLQFTASVGQIIDFDIDTSLNGPGGLGSFLRLFNSSGQELAFDNDAAAPGENTVGYDAYLRYVVPSSGTYYIGVSNANNTLYDSGTGNGDVAGGANSTGTYTLSIQAMPVDTDDQTSEATQIGAVSTNAYTRTENINPDLDVDMYRFTVGANDTVDFDIDTPLNGTGGLGSYLRLFNSSGQQIAFNDDGVAPGESTLGFDAYLRHFFNSSGTYYLGVSNNTNVSYSSTAGTGDASGGLNSIGGYTLRVQLVSSTSSDPDDTLAEATPIATPTTTSQFLSGSIAPDTDVNMYRFTVADNQSVDFDIDTGTNGPGGLDSYLRIFDSNGQQLSFNNNATAPGEGVFGFDAYLRYTFATAGNYYVGVSNSTNFAYNPSTGTSDTAGGANSVGNYQLVVTSQPLPALTVTAIDTSISELGGITFGNVTRTNADISAPLIVNLSSSDTTEATVPSTVTIPANFPSVTFTITAVDDPIVDGTQNVIITASATGLSTGTFALQVTDSDTASPGLALSSPVSTISESNGTAVGTVTRSNANITQPLVVNLVSSDTTEATVPSTVTIPANQTSATFTITAVNDVIVDGTQNITITASASGLTNGTLQMQVTDNDGGATLVLSSVASTISEANGTTIGTVTRTNAAITAPLVVNLTSNDTTEATVPSTVTIPANQTSITFTITGVDDANIDGTQNVTITATAAGLVSGTLPLQVTDNDLGGTLALSAMAASISEFGGSTVGTVTRTSANITQSLVVNLFSSDTSEASLPLTVTIPANQTSVTFTITGVDDAIVDGTQSVTITASAAGLTSATLPLQVTDNDFPPALALSAVASSISELNGTTVGTVTRTNANISQPLVVTLTSNDTTEATVPATVTIPANQTFVNFTITAVDDLVVDGTQSVLFTATATGLATATLPLQVTDNDAAASLTVTAAAASISELNGTMVGTVSRNTGNISQPLVVNLVSSDTTEATVPASVTIPANQVSATFTITAVDDLIIDGARAVTITASASGLSSGAVSFQVTDNDSRWHNIDNPLDVNDDEIITAFDALPIINYLNEFGAGPLPSGDPPPFLDVDSDNQITALDALPVINYLNENPVPPSAPEAMSFAGEFVPAAAAEASSSSEVKTAATQSEAADAYFAELGARRDRELRLLQQSR